MSNVSLVDLGRFKEVVPFDRKAFDKLLGVYFDDTRERLALIDRAVKSQSAKNVKVIAHSALGASRMLGFTGVSLPLQELEEMAGVGELTGAKSALRRTRRALKETKMFLNQFGVNET